MRWFVIILLLASCGRINFEKLAIVEDDGAIAGQDGAGAIDADKGTTVDAAGLPSGLVFNFSFDEGLPTVDSTGAHPANCTACPTPIDGRVGEGAFFDGTQCLFIPDSPALRSTDFTFAAWVKPTNIDGTGVVYGRPLDSDVGNLNTREIYIRPTGTWNVGINAVLLSSTTPQAINEWHHIAGVLEGGVLRMYFDGINGGFTGSQAPLYSDEEDTIGCDLDSAALNSFFVGRLDEVQLYNRALTAAEIAALPGL